MSGLRTSGSAEEREEMVDKFLKKMEADTMDVKKSQSYANMKVLSAYSSPQK